ncbi:hypothetical protein [Microbispora sp. NPDC049633]|uniref:hypothetical protein n=1 Tax=Microbispora sp. NPDC049633 TaxID=3154355 RepID=UPI003431ABB5
MAVYRVDQYARTFYGPNPDPRPGFDEKTFTAYSVGYDRIFLTWDLPTGEFGGFRLVTSRYGYPSGAEDGKVLVDSGTPPANYVDTDVIGGHFHYYAIFLKVDQVWVRAGTASTLHVKDHRAADWFWTRIPHHYRLLLGNYLTIDADSNTDLRDTITALAYGIDRLRTSLEAALTSADLHTTHIGTAANIAASIGAYVPAGISPERMRAITVDSTYLAAGRGHPDTLRAAGRAASGWDVMIRPSHNLMPSPDQAEIIHPAAPEWDASIHYTVGALVTTDDHLYRCIVPAYGIDQAPPGNGSNNTWWQVYTTVDDRTVAYDPVLLTQHGWIAKPKTAGVADNLVAAKIAIGLPDPVREGINTANALTIHNASGQAADVAAWSLPDNPSGDPLVPVLYGIPLPRVAAYEHTRSYRAGDLVTYKSMVWRATRPVTGQTPKTTQPYWTLCSTDARLRLTVSAYTHSPHATAQASVPVYPFITWYDEFGKPIGTSDTRVSADTTRALDTFTLYYFGAMDPLDARPFETGGYTWTDPIPGLVRDSYLGGVARPEDPDQRALSVVDYGSANATVAATFVSDAPGRQQCLILRYVDSLNYVRATRTALQTVTAGAVTTLVTYATPVADGDRLTVKVVGTNYTVLRNGVQVATASTSAGSTSTRFGLAVEE